MGIIHELRRAFNIFLPRIFANPTSRIRFVISMFLVIVDTTAVLTMPYLFKLVIDQLAHPTGLSMPLLLTLFATLWTLEHSFSHLQSFVFYPIINDCIRDTTYFVVDQLHQLPLDIFHLSPPPRTISALRRISTAARTILKTVFVLMPPALIKFIAGTLTFIIFLKPQTPYQWVVCVIAIPACFILYLAGILIAMRWYGTMRIKAWYANDSVAIALRDQLLNTRTLRFNRTPKMESLRTLLHDEAHLWYHTNIRLNTVMIGIIAVIGTTLALLLNTLIVSTPARHLTIGTIVMLKGLLVAAFMPLVALAQKARALVEGLSDMEFIANILNFPRITTTPTTGPIASAETGWRFEQISFGYPQRVPIFNHLSMSIDEGQMIAIVGDSGTGKSTLANLLVGLRRPQHGTIYFRNRDLRSYSDNELSAIIRFIPQETFLLFTTMRENILCGVPPSEHYRLDEIMNMVGLAPLRSALDEVVGDLGGRLSGGERQRVALANAILTKPQILILDETLHALSDRQTNAVLTELRNQIRTVIIVTHRAFSPDQVTQTVNLPFSTLSTPQ